MANKGSSGHIKRLNAPKYFDIHRKEHAYIIKQNPGRHTLQKSVALTLLIEKMGLASNRTEANRLIKDGQVKVNEVKIIDPKYPVGLHDLVSAGSESHIITINKRGQINIPKEKRQQVYKVIGKYKYKKNTIMLRLHDGRTVKGDAKVNDSVAVLQGKVSKVIKFGSGSKCEVIDGVHVGMTGTIKDVTAGNFHKTMSVVVEPPSGDKFETLVKNIIIVE